MSKPGKSLKSLCKRLKVRLTVKLNGKRVYKSVKVLKAQCAKKRKVKKKKKKVKRKRRRKFGSGTPEEGRPDWSPPRSNDALSPSRELHGDEPQWLTSPLGLSNSPGSFSPIPFEDSDSDEEEVQLPPPIVRRRLVFYGKKKKVERKRKKKVKNKSR